MAQKSLILTIWRQSFRCLTTVVVADDWLKEFDVIPPGDIRQLLVALSNDDGLLATLFKHRFSSDGDLGGHTIGNLLLIALTELNNGNFPKAIQEAFQIALYARKDYTG